jgi:hypothetical protein
LSSVRAVASAGSIALAVRDSIFQALTGYGSGEAAGTVVKLVSLPVAAKLAAATASVAIVGTLGAGSAPRSADTAASAKREPAAAASSREARSRPKPADDVAVLAAVHASASAAENRTASGHGSMSKRSVRSAVSQRPGPVVTDPSARPQVGETPREINDARSAYDDREPSWRHDRCREWDRGSWRGSRWSWDGWGRWGRCHRDEGDQPTMPTLDQPTAGEDDGGLPPWVPEAPEAPASPQVPAEQPTTPEAPATPPADGNEGSVGDTSAPAEPASPVDPAIP